MSSKKFIRIYVIERVVCGVKFFKNFKNLSWKF